MTAVEIRKDFDLPRIRPVAPSLMSPVKIGLGGKIAVKGVVTPPNSSTKASFSVGQADVEKSAQTEFGFVKFKQQVMPGKISKIGIEIGKTGFPLTVELAAKADYTKPFTISVKWPKLIELKGAKLSLGGANIAEGYTFKGTLDPQVNIDIAMNELWPGWPNIMRLTAQHGLRLARVGASAVRSVFWTDVEGVAMATAGGSVIVGLVAGAAALTWVAFGVYACGKALRDGRTSAARYAFCNGYARILAELTSNSTMLTQSEVAPLLTVDWQGEFAKSTRAYVDTTHDLQAIGLQERLDRTGRAAIAQDIDRFIKEKSSNSWPDVRKRHQIVYGTDKEARRRKYIEVLYQQVHSNSAQLGIPLKV
jgi:hypothetical protein